MLSRGCASALASLTAVVAGSAVLSASAWAATITVGSPLTAFNSQYGATGTNTTAANFVLAEAGARVSPSVNGTVTQWRITTVTTGQFALRVLRPAGGGQYTGAGSAPESVTSPGAHTFPANLPIQSGDLIGVDIPDGAAVAAENANGSTYLRWVPALLDGPPRANDSDFGGEILLSAHVGYPDPATAPPARTKKKCKKKKKHKRSAESAKKKKCKKKKKR